MDYEIKDSGDRTKFDTGAVRDLQTTKGRFDLIPPEPITAYAIHLQKGALKYGERNWEKGIPLHSYYDSAMRHLVQFWEGKDDENHLTAALWNVACMYATKVRIENGQLPETLDDMPHKVMLTSKEMEKQK
jgi:hypothetical protein